MKITSHSGTFHFLDMGPQPEIRFSCEGLSRAQARKEAKSCEAKSETPIPCLMGEEAMILVAVVVAIASLLLGARRHQLDGAARTLSLKS